MPPQHSPPPPAAAPSGATLGADGGQSHPLYTIDRDIVDRLLAAQSPTEADLVDAARLLCRYEGFPGAYDLWSDLDRVIRLWGLNRAELQAKTRRLWQGGYRPGASDARQEQVGSGFDATDGHGG